MSIFRGGVAEQFVGQEMLISQNNLLYIEKYKPKTFATVFSERPFAELPDQNIRFIPLYYAFSATGGQIGY